MRKRRLVIVGGGTVGLYLAAQLNNQFGVTVLEAGPKRARRFGNALDAGIGGASGHTGAVQGRATGLGGTSTIWGGQLLPWEQWEFESLTNGPAWPLSYSEIAPHYERVLAQIGVARIHNVIHQEGLGIDEPIASGPDVTVRRSTWMAPRERDFTRNPRLRAALAGCDIRVETGATRVEDLPGGGTRVHLASDGRGPQWIDADVVILAAGTIANSRILAASLGDGATDVGAGFMDHVSAAVFEYRVHDWRRFLEVAAHRYVEGVRTTPKYVVRSSVSDGPALAGYAHWQFDVGGTLLGRTPASTLRSPMRSVRELAQLVVHTAGDRRANRRVVPRDASIYLRVDVEQPPRLESRLRHFPDLTYVDWRAHAEEIHAARMIGERVVEFLSKETIGADVVRAIADPVWTDTFHLMGGTPMGIDAESGVVDRDGRVFGLSATWVAGASLFPRGGIANPTLTALAIADRTASRIDV